MSILDASINFFLITANLTAEPDDEEPFKAIQLSPAQGPAFFDKSSGAAKTAGEAVAVPAKFLEQQIKTNCEYAFSGRNPGGGLRREHFSLNLFEDVFNLAGGSPGLKCKENFRNICRWRNETNITWPRLECMYRVMKIPAPGNLLKSATHDHRTSMSAKAHQDVTRQKK